MLVWALLATLALALPLVARVAWEGRAELALAEQAREAADLEREVVHLGRAARWRLPGASHDEQALARLFGIGLTHELAQEPMAALVAYRELRRALLATRAWNVADAPLLHETNAKIARLMAAQEVELGISGSAGDGDPYAYHLALLEEIPGPNPVRANLAAWAFVGWVAATFAFLWRSIDAKGRLRARTAVRWGMLSLVLLGAWTVLLRTA